MVPGNSGSPIINHEAEVVGVATYATLGRKFEKGSAYEKMFKGTRFGKVRRYGIRIPEKGWVNDSMSSYLKQTYRLEDMKTYVMAIYALFQYWQGDSSYAAFVNRMFSAYGGIGRNAKAPFEFKEKELEELLRKTVRTFKMNHEDLTERAVRMSEADREIEMDRIKRLLIKGVEDVKTAADKTYWKSNLLKQDARAVREMSEEIINQIETGSDPYSKKRSRRR
jgi:hypothetical protein